MRMRACAAGSLLLSYNPTPNPIALVFARQFLLLFWHHSVICSSLTPVTRIPGSGECGLVAACIFGMQSREEQDGHAEPRKPQPTPLQGRLCGCAHRPARERTP